MPAPKTRKLQHSPAPPNPHGDGVLIHEYTAYLPTGFTRRKWQRESIYITLKELRQMAEKYL